MSLHSTRENRHFGASFTSLGGVESDISFPKNTEKDRGKKIHFGGIDISASTLPKDVKLAPKCLLSRVLRNDIEFYYPARMRKG